MLWGAGLRLQLLFILFGYLACPSHGVGYLGRVELHVHLDGSVDFDHLYSVCHARGIGLNGSKVLPSSPADVQRFLLNIQPVWHRFDVVNDIVGGDVAIIRSTAEAFVAFQARSGVKYTEVRYDPVRLTHSSLANVSITEDAVVEAVQAGLVAGAAKHGVAVYQILCAMRGKSAEQCFETAHLAARWRSHDMGGVVGLDLAGDEVHNPNGPYVKCFQHAKQSLGLNITVHAGEFKTTTPAEIRSAVMDMGADRVGHGYQAVTDASLLKLLRDRNVHLEACPASALNHGLLDTMRVFRDEGLNFGLNTDDPASYIGNTSTSWDEYLVQSKLGFTDTDVKRAYSAALSAAFGPARALLLQERPLIV